MPRLRILYDVEGWAFHGRALALQRHAPNHYDVSLSAWSDREGDEPQLGDSAPDIVFCLPNSRLGRLRAALDKRGWDCVVVGAWTTGWPLWISRFHQAYEQSDLLVINNHDAWARMGKLPGTIMIPNGVDESLFFVKNPIAARGPRVLWTGSVFHSAAKRYHTHVVPLMKALEASGIPVETHRVDSHANSKRTPIEMADWYNEGTVLVCASELEGTPNPCLEAAACGCTLVSTAVGNMPELIVDGSNGYLVEPTIEALCEGVHKAIEGYPALANQMAEDIRGWHYGARAAEFYEAFDAELRSRGPSTVRMPDPSRDLRDEVTVFVSTVGAPSYSACRTHLELQDSQFQLEIVDNVAPMSAAFQQMIDRCKTPYYVQVDEDMLLYPHAVRTLYELMSGADDDVAMYAGPLLDAHLRRTIYGVKIFRHDIVREFPLADIEVSESDQLRRMAVAGFRTALHPLGDPGDYSRALGLHGTHWTPRSIFERYATLERKRRRDPSARAWFAAFPPVFLERYLRRRTVLTELADCATPRSATVRLNRETQLDLYALLGALAGSMGDLDEEGKVKDYRTYSDFPGFDAASALIRGLEGPEPTADPDPGTES